MQNPLAIERTEIGPLKLINIHELPSCTSLFCFLSFLVSPSQRPRHDLRPRRSYNVLLSADRPRNRLGASLERPYPGYQSLKRLSVLTVLSFFASNFFLSSHTEDNFAEVEIQVGTIIG